LLPTIGFPAFSVHDPAIIQKSTSKCVKRLKGNYGFKRFLRDGANHLLENPSKPFYEASEVKVKNFILIFNHLKKEYFLT
jgi:phosphorylase kinase alpha/beta subunit